MWCDGVARLTPWGGGLDDDFARGGCVEGLEEFLEAALGVDLVFFCLVGFGEEMI